MSIPTHAEDADLLGTAERLLEEAKEQLEAVWDATDAQAAANCLKLAWINAQAYAGKLQREEEQEKRADGLEICSRCHQWVLKETMVLELSRQDAKDKTRVNHWHSCQPCWKAYRDQCGLEGDEDE
jgi:hypothetical protein